ncbi:hypothetical protein AB6G19_22865 [Providencia manganoxydans]
MITLTYTDISGAILGVETYSSIEEVTFHKEKSYFTKKFSGYPCYRWEVKSFTESKSNNESDIAEDNISIICKEVATSLDEKYLYKLNNESKGKTKRYIRIGTIIEIDIGFIPLVFRSDDGIQYTNKRYTDFNQKPEPHKRRMAIVISQNGDDGYYNVVLVTSIPTNKINSFELDKDVTQYLVSYNNKPSYVICDVVFPVSFTRILPPIVYDGKSTYRDNRFPTKVKKEIIKRINEKLCGVFELPYLGWISSANANNKLLENKNNTLEIDNQRLKEQLTLLLKPLKVLYDTEDVETIIQEINKDYQ